MAVDRQGQLWIWGKADARLGLGSLGSSNSDLGLEVEQSNSIKLPMMHTVLKTKGCKYFKCEGAAREWSTVAIVTVIFIS